MSDKEKAQYILAATNGGKDLPEHQWHVVMSALRDDLGQGTKLLFAEIYRELITKEAEILNPVE